MASRHPTLKPAEAGKGGNIPTLKRAKGGKGGGDLQTLKRAKAGKGEQETMHITDVPPVRTYQH